MKNFLKALGQGFKFVFRFGQEAAAIAAPWVSIAVPEVGGLFNTTLGAVTAAEGVWENAGKNVPGSGADKSAAVLPQLIPVFRDWAVKNGVNPEDPKVQTATQAAINSTVAFVKALDELAPVPAAPAA